MRAALLVSVALLLSACVTPGPIVRLTPASPNHFWLAGRAVMNRELTGVRVACAFEGQREELLVFRLEIENGTDRAFEVAPSAIGYMACTGTKSCTPVQPIVDPEQVLAELDATRARTRADQANAAAIGGTLALLNFAGSVAALGSGKPRVAADFAASGSASVVQMERDNARGEQRIFAIDASKIDWESAALRRTTLFPRGGIAGRVHVPIHETAGKIWLRVDASGRRFWFPFEQSVQRAL